MTASEQEELKRLQKEMYLNSLGGRPHAMSAKKLGRLIRLEAKAARAG